MQQTRMAKKSFESKAEGRRKVGRPRLRRLEDEEYGLLRLKLKNWREKANNKEQWASVVKEAKTRRAVEK
jgi:hypothetical protein